MNDLVENMTCLNALEGKIWKSDQKIVMSEKFVKNSMMNEKIVKNGVMNAKIDPKVVMDLSKFKIGGWIQFAAQQPKIVWKNLLMRTNLGWLLIGIPSRDPFLVTQYLERHSVSSDQHMKKLMSLREGLHVMMQCYVRQQVADRYWLHEHPGGHASWREPTMRTFTKRTNNLLCETDLYADGMFRRCNQNRVNTYGRQRVSSQTVGESK